MLVEEEIIINAPADKVYQIVKDMGRYPEFIPSLKEVTVLENGPGYTVTKWVSKCSHLRCNGLNVTRFSTKREEWNTN